jgi:hypothetical protein
VTTTRCPCRRSGGRGSTTAEASRQLSIDHERKVEIGSRRPTKEERALQQINVAAEKTR